MITPTQSDIGRRVIYDARPIIKERVYGVIAGIEGRNVLVQFDGDRAPIRVFSNLVWGDRK